LTKLSEQTRSIKFLEVLERSRTDVARDLPWIKHPDPWAVYVSEVMLQQTQVSRVLTPWREFLRKFPTPSALATASLAEVLVAWQGLGFARRARFLRSAAQVMVAEHDGQVPRTIAELRALPGIGEYSAASIASFAFNQPVLVLDTNVGRILSRAITGRTLSPAELRRVATYFEPIADSATLNQSLLDFGAKYCRARPECASCSARAVCAWQKIGGPDPARNSAKVSKPQTPFAGSRRQVRGQILKALDQGPLSSNQLAGLVRDERVALVAKELVEEGMIEWVKDTVRLSGDDR
jgi:A/G-specific adenine glycosylase